MILDEIVEKVKLRYEGKKSIQIIDICKSREKKTHEFYKALKKEGISLICEVKKASPSKGVIDSNFDYLKIAKEYEKYGASAISCLTEPFYFQGSDQYLQVIKQNVSIPVLRKDFTIYDYQIYESFLLGADAILLICAILDLDTLIEYIKIADSLGLDALVEVHDLDEMNMAIKANAKIIGVNNRNLKDFTVDINNSIELKKYIPKDVIFVTESGIKSKDDILRINPDACLIGETLMRSGNLEETLKELL